MNRQAKESGITRARALVIDDCDAVRATLVTMLAAIDYDVRTASSGAQGLEQIAVSRVSISLAIVDMQMPGLSGAQTLLHLRDRFSDLPAVLISGREQSFFKDELDHLSDFVFLQKPFSHAQLTSAIALAELNAKKTNGL